MFQALCLIILALLVIIDQLIKIIMEVWLKPVSHCGVVNGFFGFTYLQNRGAAFGVMQNGTVVLSIITAVVIAVGLYFLLSKRIKSKVEYVSIGLIISGGLGNLIDRIFRGYVVDFIDVEFMNFPIFNFADCLVTVGAGILIVYLIYTLINESKKEKAAKSAANAEVSENKDD